MALTRERLGYAPGSMDPAYLAQDVAELDARLRSRRRAADDLLQSSSEIESEARRLGAGDLLARVLIQRGRIMLAGRRYREAIAALDAADQALGDLRQHDLQVNIHAGLAEAFAGLREWDAVLEVCRQGIALVEAHRHKVSGQYLQSAYLRSRIGLYSNGVRAAHARGEHELMLRWAELSKCRSVLRRRQASAVPTKDEQRAEQDFRRVCRQIRVARAARDRGALPPLLAKRRALWDLLLIERAQGSDSSPEFSLAAVQATLEADEAVLYYYWLDRKTLLVVGIARDRLVPELVSTSRARAPLARLARGVLERSKRFPHGLPDEFRSFSRLLLPGAIAALLEDKQRLLVSPHRLLHAVPFQVLPWSDEHRYLIERFAISYVPNLSCLLVPYRVPAQPRLLALGIGTYRVPGYRKRLPPIADAEAEVGEIEQAYAEHGLEVVALAGAEACGAGLRQLEESDELPSFTTVHIAAHGVNVRSDTPMESQLFLHDSMLEGLEVANWRLGAELVVLSACCSGQRPIAGRGLDELPGDDLFGLQAAFFAAGAKRVLGSLWPVRSEVARTIMTAFHRFLLAGQAPERALQSAVVEHLHGARLGYRRSFYWAPFFLSAVGRPCGTRREAERLAGRKRPGPNGE